MTGRKTQDRNDDKPKVSSLGAVREGLFWNGKAGDHKKESATKIPGCYGSPDPEKMQHRVNKGKRVRATVGTFAATLFGIMAAIHGLEVGEDSKKLYGSFAANVAIATAAAIVVNLSLASKEITLIEILPDSPSERRPKPTNKKERSNTTALGEAPPPSLFEESSSERLRRQARRALMRQGLPLDLSSLPVHGAQTGIDRGASLLPKQSLPIKSSYQG